MINDFKSLFNQNSTIIKNDLVIGLSGGSDSIFLLFYIKYLEKHFGFLGSVFPIIVDHGLRIESNNEALKTKKIAAKLGFDSKDKVIILVARMSWAKWIKQFCEASDILRKKNPEAKFLLIGQDDKGSPDAVPERYIKKYASHNNFLHLGYRVDIKELYSISYMAVFPSYYREGGWPRGLTEPMSMGKPVITTDNIHASGAVIHGKNGFIVPMKDSYELANSIKILLDDSALASKFGQESRKLAIKNLDEKKIMSDLIQAIIWIYLITNKFFLCKITESTILKKLSWLLLERLLELPLAEVVQIFRAITRNMLDLYSALLLINICTFRQKDPLQMI